MAKFCERCSSLLVEINEFAVCSNKRCNPKAKKSGKFSNKSQFVRNKKTGKLMDKETGTTVLENKRGVV